MTEEKVKEITSIDNLNKLFGKIENLSFDEQKTVVNFVQGFLLAKEFFSNKASA